MQRLRIVSFLPIVCTVSALSTIPFVLANPSHETRDLRAGERYGEGTRVRSPFVGISFVIPAGWRASLSSGSTIFLDSSVTPGLGTIHLLTDVTAETVLDQLDEPQSIEPGFLLHPIGSVQSEGSILRGLYAAGEDVGVVVARMGPSSNAVIFQFIGRKDEQMLYRVLAEELASSTEFLSDQESRSLRRWYERLTGMVLIPKLSRPGAQTTKPTALHLCSDGRFIRSIPLQPVPGRQSDAGLYHETGTWLIDGHDGKFEMPLTKSTGEVDRQDLGELNGPVLLNGQAVDVTPSTRCL